MLSPNVAPPGTMPLVSSTSGIFLSGTCGNRSSQIHCVASISHREVLYGFNGSTAGSVSMLKTSGFCFLA